MVKGIIPPFRNFYQVRLFKLLFLVTQHDDCPKSALYGNLPSSYPSQLSIFSQYFGVSTVTAAIDPTLSSRLALCTNLAHAFLALDTRYTSFSA